MKEKIAIAAFAALIIAVGPVAATDEAGEEEATQEALQLVGDIAAGKKLYRRNCRGCHGATAMGASSYPMLVGFPADYLIYKLERYRAGDRFGPNTPLMAQRVKKLTDQDFANVAAFIVSLEDS
ncbi:MAG: c-type cytochrome [Pseudomonadota bacterium]